VRRAAYPKLAQAFEEYGIPLGYTPLPQAAAHIRSRPPQVQVQLFAALHECLVHIPRQEAATRRWLAAVLDAADNDSWRVRVRRAREGKDSAALKRLVLEVDIGSQPPSFLLWVADVLEPDPAALDLHRRIVTGYLGDFWANHNFAFNLQDGKSQEAVRYYTAALALRPDNPGVCVNRAAALRAAQELEAAILDLRRAVMLAPKYAVAHSNLGLALQAKGDLAGAKAAFAKAIEANPQPKTANALTGLGANLMRQGDVPGAIDLLRKAATLDPKNHNASFYLSEALGRLGKWKEAIAVIEKYVGLMPDDALGHNNLAWILVWCPETELRDGPRAVELAKKRHELARPDGFSWNTLGVAHYRAGNWKEAIASLEQSMRLFNGRREAMNTFVLAMTHWQMGNKVEARRWYDKAVTWMNANEHSEEPLSVYLRQFRAEAEGLLGIKDKKD
jgi:tetratricopeptide (TPR) repeat protein